MNQDNLDLFLLGIAHSLNHSLFLVLPPLLEQITIDLNASFSSIGAIATITFLIYGTGALIGGPLSDKIGSLKVARISLGLGGVMSFLFLIVNDITFFGLSMFLMALWASFYHPTANGLIAKAFTEKTGGAMGIHNAAGNIGQVLTPTIAFFLGITFNWRFSFVFFGVLSIIISYLLSRIKVTEKNLSQTNPFYFDFLKIPGFWILLLYNILVGFLFRSVDLFFPSFLSSERAYAGGIAAISNSMVILFGTLGQIIGGKGSDRYGSSKLLLGSSIGMLISLIFLLIIPTNTAGVWLFIILYGISMFSHQPAVTNLVSKISPLNLMGLTYGIMFFSTFGIGSISTTISGFLADNYSLTIAFWLNTLIAFVLLIVSILIHRRFNEHVI